jgi:tetratricopeptide (TPR) repeat protein
VSEPGQPHDPASGDAYALFQRGLSLLAERHWAQAAVPLEKAKKLEPDKTSIREALGRAYFRAGRYRRAASEFSAVVERSPANDYAHFCLGRSLQKLGDRRAAKRHLSLAYGMRPDRDDYKLYRDRVSGE